MVNQPVNRDEVFVRLVEKLLDRSDELDKTRADGMVSRAAEKTAASGEAEAEVQKLKERLAAAQQRAGQAENVVATLRSKLKVVKHDHQEAVQEIHRLRVEVKEAVERERRAAGSLEAEREQHASVEKGLRRELSDAQVVIDNLIDGLEEEKRKTKGPGVSVQMTSAARQIGNALRHFDEDPEKTLLWLNTAYEQLTGQKAGEK